MPHIKGVFSYIITFAAILLLTHTAHARTDFEQKVLDAISSCDAERFRGLVEGRNVNMKIDGKNLMKLAVDSYEHYGSCAEIIIYLLDTGFDDNSYYVNPVQTVIERDDYALMEKLLEKSFSANSSSNGEPYIVRAARYKSIDCARVLLEHRANPESRDESGNTPLYYARKAKNAEMVGLLLSYGASDGTEDKEDVNQLLSALSSYSSGAPIYASSDGDSTKRQYILKLVKGGVDVNQPVTHRLMVTAIEIGDREMVETLIDAGYDTNTDASGYTPLMAAARYDRPEIVQLLLAKGAKPDAHGQDGSTPLDIAMSNGRKDIASLLWDAGARGRGEVDTFDAAVYLGDVRTAERMLMEAEQAELDPAIDGALYTAVMNDDADMVGMLKRFSAYIDVRYPDGQTALMHSAMTLNRDELRLLLKYGASVNEKDTDGRSALDLSLMSEGRIDDMLKCMEMLLAAGAEMETNNDRSRGLLFDAARFGFPVLARELAKRGQALDILDAEGELPVVLALELGNASTARELLDAGATLPANSSIGRRFVSVEGLAIGASLLHAVESGAKIKPADADGRTPLMHAAILGLPEVAAALIKRGENVNAMQAGIADKSEYGADMTALDYAVWYGHEDVAAVLLDAGAVLKPKGRQGYDAFEIAMNRGEPGMLAFLMEHTGAKPDKATLDNMLLHAVGLGDIESISMLIQVGADTNAKDGEGRTPLIISIIEGHDEAAELLLRNRAWYYTKDASGMDAIMYAIAKGRDDVLRLLAKKYFVNLDARDGSGATPLVAVAKIKGYPGTVIKTLVELGADLNAQDNDGMTALMYAMKRKSWPQLEPLIEAGADPYLKDKKGRTAFYIGWENKDVFTLTMLIEAGVKPPNGYVHPGSAKKGPPPINNRR